MKLKNGFLALTILGTLFLGNRSYAVIYPDQTANFGDSDEENQDSVSRFGEEESKKQVHAVKATKPLAPISETSFERDSSRAPASVSEGAGRGPATVKTVKADANRDASIPKKAIVNRAKREKSYQEVAVIANESGFYPSTVFLTQGIPVRIFVTGSSAKAQCFMLDQFGVRRQIRSQKIEEITFVPDTVGTFSFSCPMNGAKGSIVVKELEVGGRVPSSVSVSHLKKSELEDDDFTPEFRNQ